MKSSDTRAIRRLCCVSRVRLLCVVVAAAGACLVNPAVYGQAPTANMAAQRPFFPPFGLDMTALDPTVRPGDDFFRYANGAWLVRTTIPPDKPFMTEAQALRDRVELQLRGLIESAASRAPHEPADVGGKVGAFYQSFMNQQLRDTLGVRPLGAVLAAIRSSMTRQEIARLMGHSADGFENGFFQLTIDVDLKDTAHYAVYVSQNGLTMPDRDYYIESALAAKKVKFRDYVQQILRLIDWPQAAENADAIVALETSIARVSWTKAEQREIDRTYNPFTPAQLNAFAPGMPWNDFLKGARVEGVRQVIVAEKTAFPKITKIFADAPVKTL
jgi:putative endopeptidase